MKTIVYAFCLASARSVWYHLGLWLYWASVERSIPSLLIREPEVEDLFDYCSTHKNSRMKRKYIYIYIYIYMHKGHECLGLHKGFALVLVLG